MKTSRLNIKSDTQGEEAIPERRLVKRRILDQEARTAEAFLNWWNNSNHAKLFAKYVQNVIRYYELIRPQMEDTHLIDDETKTDLSEINKDMVIPQDRFLVNDIEKWVDRKKTLDDVITKLGISRAAFEKKRYDMGYEIWAGTPFNGKKQKNIKSG